MYQKNGNSHITVINPLAWPAMHCHPTGNGGI